MSQIKKAIAKLVGNDSPTEAETEAATIALISAAALEMLASQWAEKSKIMETVDHVLTGPDPARRREAVHALITQAWMEGAYAGRISHATHPQAAPTEAAPPRAVEPEVEASAAARYAAAHKAALSAGWSGTGSLADWIAARGGPA